MLAKRFLCFYLFLVSALCAQIGYGQNLTISDSGQTGTSGTNWSISGNTLIVSDNASIHPNVIEKALDSGDLSILVTGEKGTIHIQSPIRSSKSRILKLIAQSSIQVYESIEISGGEIYLSVRDNQTARGSICVDGEISVTSASGQGGNILLEAKNITLSEKAVLTATGPTGGGNILIGGDWQGGASAAHRVFEDPNKLIIDRKNARQHVSFGFGIHRCMGNRLAEMQLRVLWEEISKRFHKVEVVGQPERVVSNFVRGYSQLPVILHPLA